MDPASLSIVLSYLAPIIGILAGCAVPVGIVWTFKHHKFRMRELDLEALRIPSNERLRQVEARLAAIEHALGGTEPQRSSLQDRASMMEGPPSTEVTAANPDPSRLRQR